jgi:chromosome segregation ATPase
MYLTPTRHGKVAEQLRQMIEAAAADGALSMEIEVLTPDIQDLRTEVTRLKEEAKDRDATIAGLRDKIKTACTGFDEFAEQYPLIADICNFLEEALAATPADHRRKIEAELRKKHYEECAEIAMAHFDRLKETGRAKPNSLVTCRRIEMAIRAAAAEHEGKKE